MDAFVLAAYGLATALVAAYAASVLRRHEQVVGQRFEEERDGRAAEKATSLPIDERGETTE